MKIVRGVLGEKEMATDPEQEEIDRLIKAMRDLVEESRSLAKRHEEITREYERLRRALEQAQSRRFGSVN